MLPSQLEKPSVIELFIHSSLLYLSNWWSVTKPVILPSLFQLLGTFLALGLPLYCAIFFQEVMFEYSFISRQVALIILSLPGTILMSVALWQYLIWVAALCQFSSALIKNKTLPNWKKAYQSINQKKYSKLLLLYSLLWSAGSIIYIVGIASTRFISNPQLGFIVSISSLGFLAIGLLVAFIGSIFVCLTPQVICFEDTDKTTISMLIKQSITLAQQNLFHIIIMGIVLYLITALLIPGIINYICQITGLTVILSKPLLIPVQTYFISVQTNIYQGVDNSLALSLFRQLFRLISSYDVTIALVQGSISTITTLLLLPWGTTAFTLLYLQAVEHNNNKA